MLRSPRVVRAGALALVAAALIATSACDVAHPPAAKVGGRSIDRQTVIDDLEAEAAAAKKSGSSAASANPLSSPAGEGDGTYTTAAMASALTGRIQYELYGTVLDDRGVKVTDAERQSARSSLCADPTTGQAPADGSCAALDDYPKAYQSFQVDLKAREAAITQSLLGEAFTTVKAEAPAVLRQVCFTGVQVLDATVEAAIAKAVEGGSTLEAAATAQGTSKASATFDQCLFLSGAPTKLLDAKAGEVVLLSDSSGSSYAAMLSPTKAATAKDFSERPPSDRKVSAILQKIVDASIGKPKVVLDPRYGRWDKKALAVVSPTGPVPPSTTVAPSAKAGS